MNEIEAIEMRSVRVNLEGIGPVPIPADGIVCGLYARAIAGDAFPRDAWLELKIGRESYFRDHPAIFGAGWFDFGSSPLMLTGEPAASLDSNVPLTAWVKLLRGRTML